MADKALQTRREEELVANISVCNAPNGSGLDDLNTDLLKYKLDEDFYAAGLLQALACKFEIGLHSSEIMQGKGKKGGLTRVNSAIKDYLGKFHKIGGESAEGVALLSGIRSKEKNRNWIEDIMVIKIPKEPKYDGILHEYFVGLLLNRLRYYLPNFMYVFAGFRCSAPIIQKKKVVEWCESKKDIVNYLVVEKIDGKSFGSSCKTITFLSWLSTILQVMEAEEKAVQMFSFTHGDLHDGNVLKRVVNNVTAPTKYKDLDQDDVGFWIPYEDRIIKAGDVATVIDYGRCHVKYEGHHYGYFGLEKDGLYPDKCRPFYDIYRLIMFSLYSLKEGGNYTTLRRAHQIMAFFKDNIQVFPKGEENSSQAMNQLRKFEKVLDKELKDFFVISVKISNLELNSSLKDFRVWLNKEFPEYQTIVRAKPPQGALILSCGGVSSEESESCTTPAQAMKDLSLSVRAYGDSGEEDDNDSPNNRKKNSKTMPTEDKIAIIRNTENRIADIEATKKNYETDIEYNMLTHKLQEEYNATEEVKDELKRQLLTKINQYRKQIWPQLESYEAISIPAFEDDYSIQQNNDTLYAIFESAKPLIALLGLLKEYGRNVVTLSRLEEVYPDLKDAKQPNFTVPEKYAAQLRSDAKTLSMTLNNAPGLSTTADRIRLSILAQLKWFLV